MIIISGANWLKMCVCVCVVCELYGIINIWFVNYMVSLLMFLWVDFDTSKVTLIRFGSIMSNYMCTEHLHMIIHKFVENKTFRFAS